MSVPRTVAEVLKDHVTLEVEGIDRMYLNVYVPQLQREQGVAGFFRFHRGHQFASSALMDPISKGFVKSLEDFARREKVPVVALNPAKSVVGLTGRFDHLEPLLGAAFRVPEHAAALHPHRRGQ